MYKIVQILSKSQSGIIFEYLIDLNNSYSKDEDYYNMAWRNAVKDLEVDPESHFDFRFKVIDYIES